MYTPEKVKEIMEALFCKAKETDEFEFCCALLRVRGTEDVGWDTLSESQDLIYDTLSMIEAPISQLFEKRLKLLLYCHLTEMDDMYSIIANLLWITIGERYHIDPFYYELFEDRKTISSPESKVDRIEELSIRAEFKEVGEIYDYFLIKQVRNAFFHSDYVLYSNEFRIVNGEPLKTNGEILHSVPFYWLQQRIEVAIMWALQLFELIIDHKSDYIGEKIVKARIGHNGAVEDVVLIGDGNGLRGWRTHMRGGLL